MDFDIGASSFRQVWAWLDLRDTDPNQAKRQLLADAGRDQADWRKVADRKKRGFRIFSILSIIIGGSTTGMIFVLSMIPAIPDTTKGIITGSLTAAITTTSAILGYAKYDKWSGYQNLAFTLGEEIRDFDGDLGDYEDDTKPQKEKNKLFYARYRSWRAQFNTLENS
jgi:hypothetical protein